MMDGGPDRERRLQLGPVPGPWMSQKASEKERERERLSKVFH